MASQKTLLLVLIFQNRIRSVTVEDYKRPRKRPDGIDIGQKSVKFEAIFGWSNDSRDDTERLFGPAENLTIKFGHLCLVSSRRRAFLLHKRFKRVILLESVGLLPTSGT